MSTSVAKVEKTPSCSFQTRNLRKVIPDYESLNKTVFCMTKSKLISSRQSSPAAEAKLDEAVNFSGNKVAHKILKHILERANGKSRRKNNI